MKSCAYCGRENEDAALHCEGCGTELTQEAEQADPVDKPPDAPGRVDLNEIDGAFTLRNGFSRPEWPVILKALRQHRSPHERAAAWADAISQWAGRWEAELGEDYWLTHSGSFFLLSEMDGESAERTLQKANKMAAFLRGVLGPLAWEGRPQSLIVHVKDETLAGQFDEAVALPEPLTSIERAALDQAPQWMLVTSSDESVLAGEIQSGLAWSCHSHLQLPGWLFTGVGNKLMRVIRSARGEPLPEVFVAELIPNHRRFWFEDTIQSFWAGTCPKEHPEYKDLYYELANILVHMLGEKSTSLADFLRCASPDDAGQAAARVCLKTDLGELAGTFLGPGQWAPDPLAIAECWERVRQISSSENRE